MTNVSFNLAIAETIKQVTDDIERAQPNWRSELASSDLEVQNSTLNFVMVKALLHSLNVVPITSELGSATLGLAVVLEDHWLMQLFTRTNFCDHLFSFGSGYLVEAKALRRLAGTESSDKKTVFSQAKAITEALDQEPTIAGWRTKDYLVFQFGRMERSNKAQATNGHQVDQ